jgi:hypothetical protein
MSLISPSAYSENPALVFRVRLSSRSNIKYMRVFTVGQCALNSDAQILAPQEGTRDETSFRGVGFPYQRSALAICHGIDSKPHDFAFKA